MDTNNIDIRQERPEDYARVEEVIEGAFKKAEHSEKTEHLLVKRLRSSESFIPELSLVATFDNEIVGHILLTKLTLNMAGQDKPNICLSMAPVSVDPKFQKRGIGGKLIKKAHEIAEGLGFQAIIVVGHDTYYPRFGYTTLHQFGLKLPFDVPSKNSFCLELKKNSLRGLKEAKVSYAKEFFDE